jgi:hypothetical protein
MKLFTTYVSVGLLAVALSAPVQAQSTQPGGHGSTHGSGTMPSGGTPMGTGMDPAMMQKMMKDMMPAPANPPAPPTTTSSAPRKATARCPTPPSGAKRSALRRTFRRGLCRIR